MKRIPRLGGVRLVPVLGIAVAGMSLLAIVSVLFDLPFPADLGASAFVAWAKRAAIPIPALSADDATAPVHALVEQFGSARVVGIGASSRGTHEFPMISSAIVKVMADRGITDVILDGSFESMRTIDAWVQGGAGDARQLLIAQHGSAHDTQENLDLLQWLRAWNAREGRLRSIHVRGMEGTSIGEALRCVADYGNRSGISVAIPDTAALQRLAVTESATTDTTHSTPWWTALATSDALDSLASALDAAGERRSIAPVEPEFSLARHCVEMARARYGLLATQKGRTSIVAAEDSLRANEVAWWLGQSGPQSRAIILTTLGRAAADETVRNHVGTKLRSTLGSAYVSVGMFFGEGEVGVPRAEASSPTDPAIIRFKSTPSNWLEAKLSLVSTSAFAVDLRNAPHVGLTGLYLWMDHSSRDATVFGKGRFMPPTSSPRAAFDFLLFVPTATPVRLLSERVSSLPVVP